MKKTIALLSCIAILFSLLGTVCLGANVNAKKIPIDNIQWWCYENGYCTVLENKDFDFSNSLAIVDKNGNRITDYMYNDVEIFEGGYIMADHYDAGKNESVVYVLHNGKVVKEIRDCSLGYFKGSVLDDYAILIKDVKLENGSKNSYHYFYRPNGEILCSVPVGNYFDHGNVYIEFHPLESNDVLYLNRFTGELKEEIDYREFHKLENDDAIAIKANKSDDKDFMFKVYDCDMNFLFETEIKHYGNSLRLDYSDGYAEYNGDIFDRQGNVTGTFSREKNNVDSIGKFYNGVAPVKCFERYGYTGTYDSYNLIDVNGNFLLENNVSYIGDFSEGLAVFKHYPNLGDVQYGYIDSTGNVAIESKFTRADDFKDGRALVYTSDLGYYFIDKTGSTISPSFPRYYSIGPFSEGLAVVSVTESGYRNGLAYTDVYFGAVDEDFNVVVPTIYKQHVLPTHRVNNVEPPAIHAFKDGRVILPMDKQRYLIENPLLTMPVSVPKTTAEVRVDGKTVAMQAYNIKGNNYFKLRDIAVALNGSSKQFDLTWNETTNKVNIVPKTPYNAVGGEMAVDGADYGTAYRRFPLITLGGIPTYETESYGEYSDYAYTNVAKAYNIDGNNYFKLRDICEILDVNVVWDDENKVINLVTNEHYAE